MFDKLKQMKQLKELQDSLKNEVIEVEENGIKVIVNGKMEIEEIILNESLPIKEQAGLVKKCINEAFKKIQMLAAQKMGIF